MSKSKGNGVDPMDIEEKYGTDALRFVMASLCTDNQDVRLPVKKEKQPDGREINTSEKFEIGRNFSNKLWNACRFLYPQLEQAGALAAELPMDKNLFALEDKWILSRPCSKNTTSPNSPGSCTASCGTTSAPATLKSRRP